jgi:transcriptional regulator with XRE-family HTH domain
MSIGVRVRQLRESHNLSGEKFGELCGVSKGAVSQWENDTQTPPIDKLLLLKTHKKFSDISLNWIYTGEISKADMIAQSLGVKERAQWYRIGNSLSESDDGTNGNQ